MVPVTVSGLTNNNKQDVIYSDSKLFKEWKTFFPEYSVEYCDNELNWQMGTKVVQMQWNLTFKIFLFFLKYETNCWVSLAAENPDLS